MHRFIYKTLAIAERPARSFQTHVRSRAVKKANQRLDELELFFNSLAKTY